MALFSYMQRTQQLLHDKTEQQFNVADIVSYINSARGQIAGEGQCIRNTTLLAVSADLQIYNFSAFSFAPTGTAGVFNVRQITVDNGSTVAMLTQRPFPWFNQYCLTATTLGQPTTWAQQGQGSLGSLYFYPTPNIAYTMFCDAAFIPAALALDTDAEAIPYPWTDAIPYYAASLALQSVPEEKRRGDAMKLWDQYTEFMARARRHATTGVLPRQMQQNGLVQPAQIARQAGG